MKGSNRSTFKVLSGHQKPTRRPLTQAAWKRTAATAGRTVPTALHSAPSTAPSPLGSHLVYKKRQARTVLSLPGTRPAAGSAAGQGCRSAQRGGARPEPRGRGETDKEGTLTTAATAPPACRLPGRVRRHTGTRGPLPSPALPGARAAAAVAAATRPRPVPSRFHLPAVRPGPGARG